MHKYLQNGWFSFFPERRILLLTTIATDRFNSMTEGFEWTIDNVYAAQTMCPYETVAYGFSKFCDLFTYEEWQHFGYSIDLAFAGWSAFHSPTGVSSTLPRS